MDVKEIGLFPSSSGRRRRRKKTQVQQKKPGRQHQRLPIPVKQMVSTDHIGPGVVENIKKRAEGHYYIHDVTNNTKCYGVLLTKSIIDNKLVYACPYCTKENIKAQGFTMHMKNCRFAKEHHHYSDHEYK